MNLIFLFLSSLLLLTACAESIESITSATIDKEEQYIVVFKEDPSLKMASIDSSLVVQGQLKALSEVTNTIELKSFSRVLQGGVYRLTSEQLKQVQKHPSVKYIEKDQIIQLQAIQNNPIWGLDRLDQTSSTLDKKYQYQASGKNVNAYIIDTGIRISHKDFEGRAKHGYDAVDNDNDATDCNGHGTHVAGTVGGATYGVAKHVNLIGVRVLNCQGSGRYSDVIEGVEWVTKNHVKPAVVNMSLGGPVSQALDDAIKVSIAAGIPFVVAAGNETSDACLSSPSRVLEAITVGSVAKGDKRSDFSNWGKCLDIFAPGSDILSTWHTSDSASNEIDGTSMASPHVAGVVAQVLELSPNLSPAQVATLLAENAISNVLTDVKSGSPNKLVNNAFVKPVTPEDPVDPIPDVLLVGDIVDVISGLKGSETRFKLRVDENVNELQIVIAGGSGDADLYVRHNEEPTLTNYLCRPYRWGNNEVCNLQKPKAGIYHIMLRGYADYQGLQLSSK